jgi:hypothetical protein
MTKYRKKPVEVEAVQHDGKTIDACLFMDRYSPTGNNIDGEGTYCIDPADGQLYIRTLEGYMRVSVGDYVIRGVQGEFYPCKPDIFEATYEKVED